MVEKAQFGKMFQMVESNQHRCICYSNRQRHATTLLIGGKQCEKADAKNDQ